MGAVGVLALLSGHSMRYYMEGRSLVQTVRVRVDYKCCTGTML
jgi:hypothetical protein